MTDITAVLNVHGEGILTHSSMLSLQAARREAEAAGVTVEILVVADRATPATRDYVTSKTGLRVVQTDFGDLGLARNAGVAAARGRFIAFLDGDDLWGPGWLISAYRAATQTAGAVIWHPEANLLFGQGHDPYWFMHPDGETTAGDWVTLALRNLWTSLSFARREVYEQVPYRACDIAAGIGYEDWSWNAETIAAGYVHRPVPGTVHLVRVRAGSLVRRTEGSGAMPVLTPLLRARVGWAVRVGSAGVGVTDALEGRLRL